MFAFRWMAARSCSLMRMLSFLFFIKFLSLKIKVSLLTFFSKKVSGCRASARRAAERRPAVCDARTLPKGRVQRRHPAVFCLLLRQKRKRGRTRRLQRRISPLCSSVGCLLGYPLVLHTGRFLRLFRQRKYLLLISFFCCNIYSVGLVLWV